MNQRDQALLRAAIFDVLDASVPWTFRSAGDEELRMEFVDAVLQRYSELDRTNPRIIYTMPGAA